MLGDLFYGKNAKIGKGNLYLTENRLSGNEMWCAIENHNYMCQICAKGVLDSNFNQAVMDKISNFQEIVPNFTSNFTYSQKFQFSMYNWNFLDQLLLPYEFHDSYM